MSSGKEYCCFGQVSNTPICGCYIVGNINQPSLSLPKRNLNVSALWCATVHVEFNIDNLFLLASKIDTLNCALYIAVVPHYHNNCSSVNQFGNTVQSLT